MLPSYSHPDGYERGQKFQFSLRALLRWMIAYSMFCGILRLMELDAASFAVVAGWGLLVGTARLSLGALPARHVSTLAGATVGGVYACFFASSAFLSAWAVFMFSVLGGLTGAICFVFIDILLLAAYAADVCLCRLWRGKERRRW